MKRLLLIALVGAWLAHAQSVSISTHPHSVNTIWNGSGLPSNSLGSSGDFYINVVSMVMYGPKAGTWPTTGILIGTTNTNGQNGSGVASAVINGGGHLIITLNNSTALDAGEIGGAVSFSGNTQIAASTTGSHPTNDCVKWDASGNVIDAGAPCGSGGGSSAWSALTPGTNTAGAFILGSGASLSATGGGTITATAVPFGGITGLTLTGNTTKLATSTGSLVTNDCAKFDASGNVVDTGAPCGAGGGITAPGSTTTGNIPQYSNTSGTAVSVGLGLVTTVGSPGLDTNVASEKAVRTAIAAAGGLPSQTGFAGGALVTDGTSDSWGTAIVAGPSGALDCDPADFSGQLGICDIVTSVLPRKASANTWTGLNNFTQLQDNGFWAVDQPEAFTLDPFNGTPGSTTLPSGSSATTTLTAIAAAGATSITVTTNTFAAGQGILIGVSGQNASTTTFIGTVLSVSGSTVTLTSAITAGSSYAIGANVQHDDSVALGNGFAYLEANGGGTMRLQPGFYRANNCNAAGTNSSVWTFANTPVNSSFTTAVIPIEFESYAVSDAPVGGNASAIIQTDCASGSLLNSPASISGSGFLAFEFASRGITYRAYGNPGLTMLDLSKLARMKEFDGNIDTGTSFPPSQPTTTTSIALATPTHGNWNINYVKKLTVSGFYWAFVPGAHTQVDQCWLFWNWNAIAVDNRGDHNVHIDFCDVERFNTALQPWPNANLSSPGFQDSIKIDQLQVENDGTGWSPWSTISPVDIFDNNGSYPNVLYCDISYEETTPSSSVDWNQTGGTNCFASNTGGKSLASPSSVNIKNLKGFTLGNSGSPSQQMTSTTGTTGHKVVSAVAAGASGNCANWDANGNVADAGSPCGSGGGSSAFSALTSSTNTTAAMVVGTGASLAASGTGTITATSVPDSGLPSDQCVLTATTVSYTSLTAAAATSVTFALPSLTNTSTRICLLEISGTSGSSSAFVGTSLASATVRVQSGNGLFYSPNQDVFGNLVTTANDFWSDAGNMADRTSQTVDAVFTFNVSSANLTAGSVKITIGTRQMP